MELRVPTGAVAAAAAAAVLLAGGCDSGWPAESAGPAGSGERATDHGPDGRPHRGPAERPLPSPDAAGGEADGDGAASGPSEAARAPLGDVELGEVPASAVATLSVELDPREGWQEIEEEALVDTGDAGSGVVYVNKDACRDGFCAHVYALVMGGPVESLEEYHQRFRREIADAADAELLVEEGVEVDGHPGYQVEYRLGGERDLRSLQRHAVVDGEAVVVTFTALAPMFEQWRADAEAMLDSVAVVSRG